MAATARGDMVKRIHKVLAIPRSRYVCFSAVTYSSKSNRRKDQTSPEKLACNFSVIHFVADLEHIRICRNFVEEECLGCSI